MREKVTEMLIAVICRNRKAKAPNLFTILRCWKVCAKPKIWRQRQRGFCLPGKGRRKIQACCFHLIPCCSSLHGQSGRWIIRRLCGLFKVNLCFDSTCRARVCSTGMVKTNELWLTNAPLISLNAPCYAPLDLIGGPDKNAWLHQFHHASAKLVVERTMGLIQHAQQGTR